MVNAMRFQKIIIGSLSRLYHFFQYSNVPEHDEALTILRAITLPARLQANLSAGGYCIYAIAPTVVAITLLSGYTFHIISYAVHAPLLLFTLSRHCYIITSQKHAQSYRAGFRRH